MIEAIKGLGVISAEGIELSHRTPVLALCRALIAAGHPDQPMTVRDLDNRPLMTVRSIAKAAGLSVKENDHIGPVFVKYQPFDRDNIDARRPRVGLGSLETVDG
jgi:hypothetical protein